MSRLRKQYRPGDVLIIDSDEPIPNLKSIGPQISPVRHLVGPGHAGLSASHQAVCPSEVIGFWDQDTTTYFLVPDGGARLLHREHSPLDLPAGTYRVVRQREYVPSDAAAQRSRLVFD
jgi:hypothetical protein